MKKVNRRIKWLVITLIILSFGSMSIGEPAAVSDEETEEAFEEDISGEMSEELEDVQSLTPEKNAPEYSPGELIVKLKEGTTIEALQELNAKYNVSSVEKVFKEAPSAHEVLEELKEKASQKVVEHESWYWQLDKDSQEYKDYAVKIEKEKQELQEQILAQEELVAHLEQRQKRAPEGTVAPSLENVYLLKTNPQIPISLMASDYQASPSVEYAQPNYKMKVQMLPNDPYYSSSNSWGQGYDDLWGLKKIEAEKAWDISQGEGVIVAVVDTGIDYNHEDIAENVWINAREIPNNGKDDDNNGYIDDVRGWDFVGNNANIPQEDNNPMDGFGHGTHVAGTIAAVGNNNKGIIGVAPKAKVMAVKGFSDGGSSGTIKGLAKAIIYAAENGADVINNSWGCSGRCPNNPIAEDAVRLAYRQGAVVVFAAGNSNDDVAFYSPQNMPETITVASIDHNNQKSGFSNYGIKVDVSAPGSGINSPPIFQAFRNIISLKSTITNPAMDGRGSLIVGGSYLRQAGTSMACPHAAGAVALLISKYPDWTNSLIAGQIIGVADGIDSINPDYHGLLGSGRINAYSALVATPHPRIEFYSHKVLDNFPGNNVNGMLEPGETVELVVWLNNIWGAAENVNVQLKTENHLVTIVKR